MRPVVRVQRMWGRIPSPLSCLVLANRGVPSKASILDKLVLLLLAIDEMIDGGVGGGMIYEVDPEKIVSRVQLRGIVPEALSNYEEMTLTTVRRGGEDAESRPF